MAKQFVYALNDDRWSVSCISTLDEDHIPSSNPSNIESRNQAIPAKPKTPNKLVINTFESDNNMETTYFTRQPPSSNGTARTQPSLPSSAGFSKGQLSSSTTIDFDPLMNPFPNHVKIATHHHHKSSSTPSSSITKAIDHSKQKEITTAPAKGDGSFSRDSDQACKATKPARHRKKKKKSAMCLSTKTRCVSGITVLYTKKTLPFKLKKYYFQRYSYFSKFDDGIMLDEEGWFSVTPEKIARHIAQRCTSNVIIDAFCGCGGNTIQFALTCQQVIAIDIDPVKLHCAKNNARIYGVEHKIEFILGDFFELAPYLKADVVFLSPPWGGPSYSKESNYDLASMMPGNGVRIHTIASRITPNVVFYVPKTTDPLQLIQLGPCEIERNSIQGHPKALTAYYGNLSQSNIGDSPTQCLINDENES
ncbi:hypothetical protein O0I10_009796 [Lichtheimia ornata]|uniref:Trimethylguanosine synthase n=1 Tax=Lichtheimia ornata TaxID=688661 RepID=A0AAD7UWC9_9FUNG|nr:uncharacterized protein O0I10_009796 [Lichtheimia ornata]KAJ8654490.1 hypothetical protein O0I10_009796 [Lichtheimia ornata]